MKYDYGFPKLAPIDGFGVMMGLIWHHDCWSSENDCATEDVTNKHIFAFPIRVETVIESIKWTQNQNQLIFRTLKP